MTKYGSVALASAVGPVGKTAVANPGLLDTQLQWDAAYPLSYRHLEEMKEERGVWLPIRRGFVA